MEEKTNTEYKELPSNIEAEQALLGSLLIENRGFDNVADFLTAEHFFHPIHAQIYESIKKITDKGLLANPITLKPYFTDNEGMQELGGVKYLVELATKADRITNIKQYANSIYNLALNRSLIALGKEVTENAHDMELPAINQIEQAEQKLFSLAETGDTSGGFEDLSTSLATAIHHAELAIKHEGITGITTGLDDLNHILGGLRNSDLLILAARPSMGKTALATCIAYNAAKSLHQEEQEKAEKEGRPFNPKNVGAVGIFSLEMSSEQLAARILSVASGINSSNIFRGGLSNDDFSKLVDTSQEISDFPICIDDTPALTISAIRTRARRLKRQQNLSLLVVDYLQLLRGTNKSSEGNRVQEISEISQGLKAIAKELDIPVVALSQLSRAVEQREDKRPLLSDLRESGSIEQDADIVMFIYRAEYYLGRREPELGTDKHAEWQEDMEKVLNLTEVIVAKQRNGPIGNVRLRFDANTTRFSDFVSDEHLPEY